MLRPAATVSPLRAQRGATLIEVLVALLILLVGLLGLAGLNSRTNMMELESFQRIQALQLVQDMVARLRANADHVACYANPVWTTADEPPPVISAGSTLCERDLADWRVRVAQGARTFHVGEDELSELGDDQMSGGLIGARGCIEQLTANEYRVTVAWQGLQATVAPTLANDLPVECGKGQYGDERLHRVAAVEMLFANFGAGAGAPPEEPEEPEP